MMDVKKAAILSIVISLFLIQSCSINVKAENYSLTIMGEFDDCYFAFDVQVENDIAYIADAGDGLWIVDVADPTNPTTLSHKLLGGVEHVVQVKDNIVFVADYHNGLFIFNVTNPSNPQQISNYGDQADIVVCNDEIACISDPHLIILNITDLTNPTEIYNYVEFPIIDVIIRDDLLFCLDLFTGLKILNISNPATPVQINQWLTSEIMYRDIEIYNDIIFLASSTGLKALDVSNINDIQDLGVDSGGETVRSLAIENDILYISEPDTDIEIYDITDMNNFNEIGQHTENGIVINSIYVANNIIYATAESDGLIIFNIESDTSSNTSEVSLASFIIGIIGVTSICFGYSRNKKRR
ncbi:MAG: hypothetical protein FK733_05830 [Asgard group archaeon]|nr:hypothetical protein [Asgard group archaeon]